ncbi:hypothetical protein HanOQP8_Chr14g0507221 [Helianthus annuus]|nr:hypothetical protein HanOQP8_Chr14g0507221 [Helianthus annuus]
MRSNCLNAPPFTMPFSPSLGITTAGDDLGVLFLFPSLTCHHLVFFSTISFIFEFSLSELLSSCLHLSFSGATYALSFILQIIRLVFSSLSFVTLPIVTLLTLLISITSSTSLGRSLILSFSIIMMNLGYMMYLYPPAWQFSFMYSKITCEMLYLLFNTKLAIIFMM